MDEEELLNIEALASNYSYTIYKLKQELCGNTRETSFWPTLHLKENNEFIIEVPFRYGVKVQYIPFYYGELAVEINK